MAESGLSIAFAELKAEVGHFLGHGRGGVAFADWEARTPDPTTEVEALVQSGVRQVYYPPALSAEIAGYEWSFLRPSTTLPIGASGTDGSIVGDQFDSATYADWTAQGITTDDTVYVTAPAASVGTYTIDSVAAGAITLTESPGDATDLTFNIRRGTANYALPDDFSRLIGSLHYGPDTYRAAIKVVSSEALLEMRARDDRTDYPFYAASRSKSSDRTTGQRSEILFWPALSASAAGSSLYYAYEAYSGKLSDTYPYPLGGMYLAELYIESCLAIAEQRIHGEAGLHSEKFKALLVDAIARDRKKGAQIYGQMGHQEPAYERIRHGDTGGTYPITYNGAAI